MASWNEKLRLAFNGDGSASIASRRPAEILREGREWTLSRPLRLWRLIHAMSCFAAAVSRVNVPSALYLFFFVAQVSLVPLGAVYRGTSRVEMSRIEVLHAWFKQR